MRSSKVTPYKFIKELRESCPQLMLDIFQYGSCYRLYLLLKMVFPNATLWYDRVVGHVYTEIDGKFYDIRGWHKRQPHWENVAEDYGLKHFHSKAKKWIYEPPTKK